jgi:hypothetical protein
MVCGLSRSRKPGEQQTALRRGLPGFQLIDGQLRKPSNQTISEDRDDYNSASFREMRSVRSVLNLIEPRPDAESATDRREGEAPAEPMGKG